MDRYLVLVSRLHWELDAVSHPLPVLPHVVDQQAAEWSHVVGHREVQDRHADVCLRRRWGLGSTWGKERETHSAEESTGSIRIFSVLLFRSIVLILLVFPPTGDLLIDLLTRFSHVIKGEQKK